MESAKRFIREIESVTELLEQKKSLANSALQGLDLSEVSIDWKSIDLTNVIFLGCKFASYDDEWIVRSRGAYVFPLFEGLPYNPYRSKLYTWQELMRGYDPENDQSLDYQIYQHVVQQGRDHPNIREMLAQRIHDHAIDDALWNFLDFDQEGMSRKKGVGFMGGHSVLRTAPCYRSVAEAARLLAREGYLIISGGGPGIMEAANLGAYMAGYSSAQLEDAISHLCQAPSSDDPRHALQSQAVLHHYPHGHENLAIPTWFYGHEPSNLFASHIAKYFSNSIREDGLLAISLFGVVFAPGSAGTTQEIFMDATQNHYGSFGYYTPMIFLGKQRYLKETFLFPLVQQLAWGRKYSELLCVTDSAEEVLSFITEHPPVKVPVDG
ncbi:hypothetical protein CSB45_08765 [candidate division KSB3 bacterium]|uniref:Rossmann fold nucleotide-binding protein n=1 Tax=candidate division KSB3 bacterium TaxID=2044937 RepID=A0A2G6E4L2_9BACT|nr:MAG: hypothetical protein CSB45_08765 [candidate division KSB3 bacterium]PIE29687.1 MAG: hypothetical protein CSA57_07670 [candidate division KSB3 bacterium]